MPTVFQRRPKGNYYYRITLPNGQRIKRSTGLRVKAAAQRVADQVAEAVASSRTEADLVMRLHNDMADNLTRMRIRGCWGAYLKTLADQRLTRHRAAHQVTVEKFQAWAAENNLEFMADIKPKQAQEYASTWTGIASATYNARRGALVAVWNALAVHEPAIRDNPWKAVKRREAEAEVGGRVDREPFTPDEMRAIAARRRDWVYPLFVAAFATGMRQGDIVRLTWDDSVNITEGWINAKTHKTRAHVRLPMFPGLRAFLQQWPRGDSRYVFPEHYALYMRSPSTLSKRIKEFLRSIELPDGSTIITNVAAPGRARSASIKDFHSCRHTFAFIAMQQPEISEALVRQIVGWKSVEVARRYGDHMNDATKSAGMDVLATHLDITSEC